MTGVNQTDEFDFSDLKIIEVSVKGPNGKSYMLREASGAAAAQFNNARAKCAKFKDGELESVTGPGRLPLYLISLCLFNTKDDGTANINSSVSLSVIQPWPDRVIQKLFDKSKEISEIDEDDDLESLVKQRDELNEKIAKLEEDAAKNELESSETGLSTPEKEVILAPLKT